MTDTWRVKRCIIIIIMVYFRQKPTEYKKAMNSKTRETEYKRAEMAI